MCPRAVVSLQCRPETHVQLFGSRNVPVVWQAGYVPENIGAVKPSEEAPPVSGK